MTEGVVDEEMTETPREAVDLTDYLNDEATVLPPVLETDDIATSIRAAFDDSGGATYSIYFGSMVGKPFFAVSIYQERESKYSKSWQGRSLEPYKLRAFLASCVALLLEPRNSVGVWYDIENDQTYLEVTATLPFRDKADYTGAIGQGRRYNQIGIYDLEERVYLSLDGTGELPAEIPPVTERLPALERGGGEL